MRILLAVVLAAACASSPSPEPASSPAQMTPAGGDEPAAVELPECRSELIPLPPEFAPSLPPGKELLWFSPGMFDPAAPDYFTYAFRIVFEPSLTFSKPELKELLTQYYQGLMSAVAEGKKRDPASVTTEVQVSEADLSEHSVDCGGTGCVSSNRFFVADIRTQDHFGEGSELHLVLLMDVQPEQMYVTALPKQAFADQSLVHGEGLSRPTFAALRCRPTEP